MASRKQRSQLILGHAEMHCNTIKDCRKRANAQRIVIRDGDVMFAVGVARAASQPHVSSRLPGCDIAKLL